MPVKPVGFRLGRPGHTAGTGSIAVACALLQEEFALGSDACYALYVVPIVKSAPLLLQGPWSAGYVLEPQHTLSSEFLGHDSYGHPQFATKRSELGELVFRLKNRNDKATLKDIADTAADFLGKRKLPIDAIVPVPPSRRRAFQPVLEIAKALAERLSSPLLKGAVTKTRETPQLKDVFGYDERQKLLDGAFSFDRKLVEGRRVLLVDDLYRSGATAAVVTQGLIGAGASAVYFLAITKTRTRA
jgi:predicted amidophosphoribosyltransferase